MVQPPLTERDDFGTKPVIALYVVESEQDSDFRSIRPKIILRHCSGTMPGRARSGQAGATGRSGFDRGRRMDSPPQSLQAIRNAGRPQPWVKLLSFQS
jgi:hypothetical protein